MIKTCEDFISGLKKEGLSFRNFSLIQEGEYHPDDADWNYKDVPHLHFIHKLVEAVPARIEDDFIVSVNLQKIFGITMPLTVVNLESGPHSQMYFTTLGPFTLVIESAWAPIDAKHTRVTTTYHIGMRWYFLCLVPLITWSLKRNYRDLMSGDIPMRTRRGCLRAWGYRFEKRSGRYGFTETMAIARANVINNNPLDLPIPNPEILVDSQLPKDGDQVLWGRSDHLGLRILRIFGKIHFYPRMCPHEGAELDNSPCKNSTISCPWHGRAFKPLAILTIGNDEKVEIGSRYSIDLRGNLLRVHVKEP